MNDTTTKPAPEVGMAVTWEDHEESGLTVSSINPLSGRRRGQFLVSLNRDGVTIRGRMGRFIDGARPFAALPRTTSDLPQVFNWSKLKPL